MNDALRRDLIHAPQGEHASNLGGLLAVEIASRGPGCEGLYRRSGRRGRIDDVARVCGHALFRRVSIFHALNQKAVSRIYAARVGESTMN